MQHPLMIEAMLIQMLAKEGHLQLQRDAERRYREQQLRPRRTPLWRRLAARWQAPRREASTATARPIEA